VYLKDLFARDAEVVKQLGRLLDRRSIVLKNHENLADLLNAPPLIKGKCKSNTEHSPTLDLLQLPKVCTITVNILVGKLRDIKRNDVAGLIEEKIPGTINYLYFIFQICISCPCKISYHYMKCSGIPADGKIAKIITVAISLLL
jgi:hypothetical protein